MFTDTDISLILKAVHFASIKHKDQRRKDGLTPYINHPIEVAQILWQEGEVRSTQVIAAAILHDTIEDTNTEPDELEAQFGSEVLGFVKEVTDDKSLPKSERKRLQIVKAPSSSVGAKQIKIADKICNIRDLISKPPADWPLERKQQYLVWSREVMKGLRGCNAKLEALFDEVIHQAHNFYHPAEHTQQSIK